MEAGGRGWLGRWEGRVPALGLFPQHPPEGLERETCGPEIEGSLAPKT